LSYIKIVATIGPITNNEHSLRKLRDAGMGIARLNGSHGDINWHTETINLIRKTIPNVPLLLDIPGRKVRLGLSIKEKYVKKGEQIILDTDASNSNELKIGVNHANLHKNMSVGDIITIDDSSMQLQVEKIAEHEIFCVAIRDGMLLKGKGLHVPGSQLNSDLLSSFDYPLIDLACKLKLDYVGLSFVDDAVDVNKMREIINGNFPKIISKIETSNAIEKLREVMISSDAIMIDRGDLSAETNWENIAIIQKFVLEEARRMAMPVIIATEMLQSMIEHPIPTKAEITDITNAVLDGASALMLSGETAVGKYPVHAVEVMRKVADAAFEHMQTMLDTRDGINEDVPNAIGAAIEMICRRLDVKKIVAITISGYAARMIAIRKPRQLILAVSNNYDVARSLNLLPGTKGMHIDIPFSKTEMTHIPLCLERLWAAGELSDDELILVTAVGYPKSGNRMNLIETHKVSDLRDTLGWKK
jgi:pyruvate kinase